MCMYTCNGSPFAHISFGIHIWDDVSFIRMLHCKFLSAAVHSSHSSLLPTFLSSPTTVGKNSYEKGEYYNYISKRTSGLSFILVTDKEYPPRVAFTLLHKISMDFENAFSKEEWQKERYDTDGQLKWDDLKMMLDKYQDPHEADDLMKIKQDLAETKEIVHQALEKVMERGEKMENLVSRSNDLSYASKLLFTTSADENSCCILM